MTDIREIARSIEKDLVEKGIILKLYYINNLTNQNYHLISTPDVFEKKIIFIIVSGHPEIAGVWSNTLLSKGDLENSSMEAYFKEFYKLGWGLIALNPHLNEDDLVGVNYINQIHQVLEKINSETKIGFIGFSMGGRIIYDFLNNNSSIIEKVIAIGQIDPVIQSFKWDKKIIELMKDRTVLFASSTDQYKFGIIASALLDISSISIEGIHGSLPNKCLIPIIDYIKSKLE